MDHRPSLLPPADAEHYDDLSELERERHENDMRLKNTFEHIFDKYSRDFSTIGDEIDLETGEIVVDNGHIAQLQDERDTGEAFDDWDDDGEGDEQEEYGEVTYTQYEVGDSEDEDELLSSPPRTARRRVSQPGELFTSLSSLTWQTSTIGHPSSTSASRRGRSTNNRPAISLPEVPQTPQRMDLANDPAFFQALGQSIAQGIAQYMTVYRDTDRPADPVWDAPPLPRPSDSSRRHVAQPRQRRAMIPESPRHPPSRSVWATGRPVGRPRTHPRPPAEVPNASPSVRNNASRRQPVDHPGQRPENLPPHSRIPQVEEPEELEDAHVQYEEHDQVHGDEIGYEGQDDVNEDDVRHDILGYADRDELQYDVQDYADQDELQYDFQGDLDQDELQHDAEDNADEDEIQYDEHDNSDEDRIQYEQESADADNVRYENQDDAQADSQATSQYQNAIALTDADAQHENQSQEFFEIADEDPMDLDYVLQPDIDEEMEVEEEEIFTDDEDDDNYEPERVHRRRSAPARDHTIDKAPSTPGGNGAGPGQGVSASATRAEPVKQKLPGGFKIPIPPKRKFNRGPQWSKDEDDLFIELKEVRKLPFPQVARYFPDRNPRSIENHWYKIISMRKDKKRGEMSDYVRRAIERGPILANKVRMKPYVPKNPEKARPDRANLTDQTSLLQDEIQKLAASRPDDGACSSLKSTVTPAPHMPPDQTPLEAQDTPHTPPLGSECEDERVYATGDPKKPWGCKKCGRTWQQKSSSKYHFADPSRCIRLPAGRLTWAGRRNKTAIPPKAAPPSAVPPGVDITNGRPAPFNPNIIIREEMERTHLCTLCGKSWASHSNAREHTRRPEQCIPDNWLINYDPGAHRKRKAEDIVTGPADSGTVQHSKRSKKNESSVQQASRESHGFTQQSSGTTRAAASEESLAFVENAENRENDTRSTVESVPEFSTSPHRGFPERFTVSDKVVTSQQPGRQIPIDPQLLAMAATSMVTQTVQERIQVPDNTLGIKTSPPQPPQISSIPQAKVGPTQKVPGSVMENRVNYSSSTAQRAPIQGSSSFSTNRVGFSLNKPTQETATQGSKSSVQNRVNSSSDKSLQQAPIHSLKPVMQNHANHLSNKSAHQTPTQGPRPVEEKGVSSFSNTSNKSVQQAPIKASMPDPESLARFSSSKKIQQVPIQRPITGNTNAKAGPCMTEKSDPQRKGAPTQTPAQRTTDKIGRPASVSSLAAGTNPHSKTAGPTPGSSTSKSARVPVEERLQRSSPLKSTPQTQPWKKSVTQPAKSAPAKRRRQDKPGGTITPQVKSFGDSGRSSPLNRITKSDPRARTSFVDLLADDSGDELAF